MTSFPEEGISAILNKISENVKLSNKHVDCIRFKRHLGAREAYNEKAQVETPLDIIPHGHMEPHINRPFSEAEMTSAAIEGFEACTEEAIRYLIEDEKLPADDPMVIGLREYLYEKQKALAYTNLFEHQFPNFSLPTSHPVNWDSFDQCEEYSLRSDNLSDQSTDSIETSNITSESVVTSEQEMTTETEMAESVNFCNVDDMCLPEDKISAIRALTEELLSLMEEDDFSDFDDDDDMSDNDEELDH